MNSSNFNQTGGYPLKTERLQELQTAYSIFNSLGALAGNFTIISGCVLTGTTVGNGFVYINGELLEFREANGAGNPRVIIIEESVTSAFKNGVIKQVHTIRYATFGTADESWPWSDFKRPIETKSIADWQTNVINRLEAIETKLNTIEKGAQVNVASNWNVTDPLSDAYIFNKPDIKSDILYKGSVNVGDCKALSGNVSKRTVVSFPNVGTTNYTVLGSLTSGSGWDNDSGVFWSIADLSATSFAVITREIDNRTQNQWFQFVLIKN
jgi:hypothetical protein